MDHLRGADVPCSAPIRPPRYLDGFPAAPSPPGSRRRRPQGWSYHLRLGPAREATILIACLAALSFVVYAEVGGSRRDPIVKMRALLLTVLAGHLFAYLRSKGLDERSLAV